MMQETCGCGGSLVIVQVQDLHAKAGPRLETVCFRSLRTPETCTFLKPSRKLLTKARVLGGTRAKPMP